MPVVSETIDLPGGASPSRVTVTIELVGARGLPVEGFTSSSTVVGKLTPTITEGAWSATLVANDDITPSGTVYKRTISGAGVGTADLFEVPSSGGPYTVEDLLTTAPASIEPSTYAVLADRVTELEDNPGGAVASVDGQTGVVVLSGTYDALGAAAAAQAAAATDATTKVNAMAVDMAEAIAEGDTQTLATAAADATSKAAAAQAAAAVDATTKDNANLRKASNLADVANAATALANLGGAPLADPTFTGVSTAPTLKSSGNGAGGFTNPGRFLGVRTAVGPPTTGTWLAGDWGFASDGVAWFCTVAGTPGTWIDVSASELDSKTDSTDVTNAGVGGLASAIPGCSITGNLLGRPGLAHIRAYARHTALSALIYVQVYRGGVFVDQIFDRSNATNANTDALITGTVRIPPAAAGSETFDLRVFSTATVTVRGTAQPSALTIVRT